MSIRLLDTHTAELIAAGEVVERPASVVKELVENAIDAGADLVEVEIKGGGIALIRVADDGEGIPAVDIPLAFLRHATSKVCTERDLDAISTLGFRGEALASIASVSRVELLTKNDADADASLYRIEGGAEQELELAARGRGATFTVTDLFYNTPARMKFLKKDASEGGFVTEVVERLALSHPEVTFRYIRDGKPVFSTPGDGKLESAVYAVLGAVFGKELLAVEGSAVPYSVEGFVTRPRGARASRNMQYFYINGRFVKNRTMMAAVEQAYRGTVMHGKFPGCVMFLHMPPELVDVNVHPAKTEVRFADERAVFEVVYGAVKRALAADDTPYGSLELGQSGTVSKGKSEAMPTMSDDGVIQIDATSATFASGIPGDMPLGDMYRSGFSQCGGQQLNGALSALVMPGPQELGTRSEMLSALASDSGYAPYEKRRTRAEPGLDIFAAEEQQALEQTSLIPSEKSREVRVIGELFSTYILAESGDVFCLIDKHAAHERILYEKLAAGREEPEVQQLLNPQSIELSAEEKDALMTNLDALLSAGIEVEDFGGNTVLVRGVPADVEPENVTDLVVEIATRLAVNPRDTVDEKTTWVLHSMACRAARKAGDRTPEGELLHLTSQILQRAVPPYCPHGRPVVLEMTRKEIERQFGRLV